jgi:nucleoporin SEH1
MCSILTGYSTVLSSAGNDGHIRLWKATYGGVWKPLGHIHTEHGDEEEDGMRA